MIPDIPTWESIAIAIDQAAKLKGLSQEDIIGLIWKAVDIAKAESEVSL